MISRSYVGIFLLLLSCVVVLGAVFFVYRDPKPVAMVPKPNAYVAPLGKIKVTFDRPVSPAAKKVKIERSGPDGNAFPVDGELEYLESGESIVFTTSGVLKPARYNVKVYSKDNELAHWRFSVADVQNIVHTEKNPILLVNGEPGDFSAYYAEILRAEGLTGFTIAAKTDFPKLDLADYQSIIISGHVDDAAAVRLKEWVEAGGNLVAIQPVGAIAELAGVVSDTPVQTSGYLRFDTDHPPGEGLVKDDIQFHGQASRLVAEPDVRILATLVFDGNEMRSPAATVRSIGSNGGEVAALAFDLAQSVVLTRQGNPEWAGQDRDGLAPIRPNDLFFGGAKLNPRLDFLNLDKVHIPQADETMRFLSNLLIYLQRDGMPLPRFWYFPKNYKAVIVMTADDHGTKDGTRSFFQLLDEVSPDGCEVSQWECARATSWLYANSGLKQADALRYARSGFEIGSHITTDCKDWTRTTLNDAIARDLVLFQQRYPDLRTQVTSRLHCLVWSEYTTQPEIERSWGIRFDMNYYYWPNDWLKGRPGFMTGSGLPMRFSTSNGEIIDVYQQETHLVDEVFFSSPAAVEQLIARAVGPEGFYGAFGTHFDFSLAFVPTIVDIALKWQVPMVSAKQMLTWLDARSQSQFNDIAWNGQALQFTISAHDSTNGLLTAMLPIVSNGGNLTNVTRNGETVEFTTETIKGIEYAFFPAIGGSYEASYKIEAAQNSAAGAR